MTFVDRAQDFLRVGGDQYALLRECVADRGANALAAVQLLTEDMYGGITFNFELKAPAAYALVGFGVPGLRALFESAKRTPTSKNISLGVSTLASVAAGTPPRYSETFAKDDEIRAVVQRVSIEGGMADAARALLREYVLGIEDETDAIALVGTHMSRLGWSADDPGVASELFAALAARRLATGPAAMHAFEQLIEAHSDDEPTFHAFFERYPQLLDPAAAEVWSKPDLAGAREPDFVIRRTDDSYLVVEIETPAKQLITSANQLAAPATQAVAQATTYRSFLVERFQHAAAYFPRFSEPDCLVVIGLEGTLSADQRAALARENRSRSGLRIVGYDWLVRRALSITSNIVEPKLSVRSIRVI